MCIASDFCFIIFLGAFRPLSSSALALPVHCNVVQGAHEIAPAPRLCIGNRIRRLFACVRPMVQCKIKGRQSLATIVKLSFYHDSVYATACATVLPVVF